MRSSYLYTDSHCHAHELSVQELAHYEESFDVIVAVSDDLDSSLKTLTLTSKFKFLHPCVGIHPWSLNEIDVDSQIRAIEKLVVEKGITCLGEIGLDKAFVPHTLEKQIYVFKKLLDIARDYDLGLNLHAAKAWRLVLKEVVARGIKRVLFHWYTGPPDVLAEIAARGYLISINPTVQISRKHMAVAKNAPLSTITFESDGPYSYRGLELKPSLIPKIVEIVARERGVTVSELVEIARENLRRFLE